jgi:hypothetical protein
MADSLKLSGPSTINSKLRNDMTPRERLQATLDHKQPDKLCVDFGATAVTGMGVCTVTRLRKALLGGDERIKVIEPYQMLGEIDEEMRRTLGLDVMGVWGRNNLFGFPSEGWKPFQMHDGTPVQVPERFNVTQDEDGGWLIYPEGDTSVPPSARMPKTGYFFDSLNRQEPVDEDKLDPMDNCEEFGVLSGENLRYFKERVDDLYQGTDYGILMVLPGAAFGDIALVPAMWLKRPKGIRDVEEWYVSTAMRRDYVYAVFEKQLEIALKNIEILWEAVGNRVQAVFVTGTDFGAQRGLFISPKAYRDLYKPFHKAINDKIHSLTTWKSFCHSCGSIYELIPDLIEAGFDILNPVQCSAEGMEPRRLKSEFGNALTFWGGGVDTQHTLPFGTPEEVYKEVRERIEIFAPGGGYVFNAIHNVQSNVPVENVLAMFKALKEAR